MKIAYLGPEGSHTERAAQLFAKITGAEVEPVDSIYSAFEAVEEGKYSVVPSENSTEGSVTLTLDLLLRSPVRIFAEVSLSVRHSLIGYPGATVRKVYSHPQALAQCREYIRNRSWEAVSTKSTADAVKFVAECGDPSIAAIGSEEAAEKYGLEVLERDIQDNPNNKTRFILIGPQNAESPLPGEKPLKASLFFELENVPGALWRALGVFARRGVNLSRIESRPSLKDLGYYVFYVDYERPEDEGSLLQELGAKASYIKYLGSYPVIHPSLK